MKYPTHVIDLGTSETDILIGVDRSTKTISIFLRNNKNKVVATKFIQILHAASIEVFETDKKSVNVVSSTKADISQRIAANSILSNRNK